METRIGQISTFKLSSHYKAKPMLTSYLMVYIIGFSDLKTCTTNHHVLSLSQSFSELQKSYLHIYALNPHCDSGNHNT